MTNDLQNKLNKLREVSEKNSKYVVNQTHKLFHRIFVFDLNSELDPSEIVQLCKTYQKEEFREKETQSVYAWRSDYTPTNKNPMKGFEKLLYLVENKINSANIDSYTYLIDHFWFAIYNKGDNSKLHNHRVVDLACVYYASVPLNSAPLIIPSDDGDLSITPKEGTLVIMPGYCNHMVPKSEHENGERIIVAMNAVKDRLVRRF
jgi:hypothetical protein